MSTPEPPADILASLRAYDAALMEWLLHASPTTDDERQEVKQLRELRTQLTQLMNEIVEHRMRLATAPIKAHAARLAPVCAQIKATAKTISTVKDVLHATGEAVSVASTVLAAIV